MSLYADERGDLVSELVSIVGDHFHGDEDHPLTENDVAEIETAVLECFAQYRRRIALARREKRKVGHPEKGQA